MQRPYIYYIYIYIYGDMDICGYMGYMWIYVDIYPHNYIQGGIILKVVFTLSGGGRVVFTYWGGGGGVTHLALIILGIFYLVRLFLLVPGHRPWFSRHQFHKFFISNVYVQLDRCDIYNVPRGPPYK